jgi:ABC-2 type transport system permease protein
VSDTAYVLPSRLSVVGEELGKLPAFLRRDFLVAWSYRLPFVSDWVNLVLQAFLFYFVGLMVDERVLPRFNGSQITYMEFVAIGIALGAFVQLGLGRVAAAIRNEQLMGTLESLLLTPTSPATIQLGAAVYDLIYVPIRTAIFFLIIVLGFGLDFQLAGAGPAAVILLLFIPFVWGLGVAAGAFTLTFRRGFGSIGFGVTLMTAFSGAYFPLGLLPGWAETIATLNPIALAIDGMREALLGGAGWSESARAILVLLPISAVSLAGGFFAFRRALARERRLGTLGLY